MKAVLIREPGGPEVLALGEAEDPVPGPGEILVAVQAAGVNRADLLQRMGRYPPPPGASSILGLELAGRVVGLGPETRRFHQGDRVMALVSGGAYASLAKVPESTAMPIPDGMSWDEAAAIPEAFLTAWLNLFDLGRLRSGESVLIHAGASGVGSAAIQLARDCGARVLTTAGTEAKLDFCRDLGAEIAIHRTEEDFAEVALQATGGEGVHLILDFVGAPYWEKNLKALGRNGRLMLIGFLGGSRAELDLGPILRKSLTVAGTTLRGSSPELKARLTEDFMVHAGPRFRDGRLRALVDRVFPLAEAAAAHTYVSENRNAGKVILSVE